MTTMTRWLGTCAGLVLMAASCGARDTSTAEGVDASTSVPSYAPTPEQQVRAAYISARQSESASDPAYAFHQTGNAMETVHPASQMRALVTGDGVTLSKAGEAWTATLHTASIGCHPERSEGSPGDPSAAGLRMTGSSNRVQVDKNVGEKHFTELYIEGVLGLEQGWTLRDNPCASGAVELRVDVAGLSVVDGKDGIDLRDESGQNKAHYTDAWARDAKGRPLETTMSASGGSIAIRVDTRGATFPVEIDPLVWFQQQELTASDGAANDYFGDSVAISGATAVVGVSSKTVGANAQQGAVYVFAQSGTAWAQQQKLTASGGAAGDYFGGAVALSGGTLVVGAAGASAQQGVAYVFVQNGTTWTQQQKLTAADGAAGDYFGSSVALSGGTAVVGAVFKSVGANFAQGAAYVFVQSGATWPQQQELIANDGAANDYFGNSVAVSGGTAVVGAAGKKIGANVAQGGAYVFVQGGTTWSQQQTLTASDGAKQDYFGSSVAVSGNTAMIGDYTKTVGFNVQQGAAYMFVQSGTTWIEQQRLIASDGATQDRFGYAVAVSGSIAFVGAQAHTVGSNAGQGVVYAFNDGPSNGTPCAKPSECGSGFCVDGFCCDTACKGVCQACAAALKPSGKDDGLCGPATTGTNPHKDPCPIDAPATCGHDGLCDGAGACRVYAASGTTCATACAVDQETDSACDGNGKCLVGAAKTCGNYLCDAIKCKTSCNSKSDCSAIYACQAGKCVASAICSGNDSQSADGSSVHCAPYQCGTNGTCKSTCNSVDDCAPPAACNTSGKCVVPASSDSGGCAVSGGGLTPAGFVVWLLMAGTALVITKMRRRSRARNS